MPIFPNYFLFTIFPCCSEFDIFFEEDASINISFFFRFFRYWKDYLRISLSPMRLAFYNGEKRVEARTPVFWN